VHPQAFSRSNLSIFSSRITFRIISRQLVLGSGRLATWLRLDHVSDHEFLVMPVRAFLIEYDFSTKVKTALLRKIKSKEVDLGVRLEAIHVPGLVLIVQGTDGLRRGALYPAAYPTLYSPPHPVSSASRSCWRWEELSV
jgi:hypothetical protein